MNKSIIGTAILETIEDAKKTGNTRSVSIDNEIHTVPYPFPSPTDWRDCPIYFLVTDRFNNPQNPPLGPRWDEIYDFRHGGTFNGIRAKLGYIANLGMKAIWMSPVLKNARPDSRRWNYPGYGTQNFLEIDDRLGSESELQDLVTEAHARGLYIIFDIVLNHTARVFDYVANNGIEEVPPARINCSPGNEYHIQWLKGNGQPNAGWQDNIPSGTSLSADDAIYPDELRNYLFFRRQGPKTSDTISNDRFVKGDFGSMRQMVVEYDATVPGQENIRSQLGPFPVLNILIQSYQYLIARFDCDGFRIDTAKYIHPDMLQTFGNAIREFCLSIGKKNFFTFAEVADNEDNISKFIGRNGSNDEGFGVDAALDFSLCDILPKLAKCQVGIGVEDLRNVFEKRKSVESQLLSSHGEAGRFFVSFNDNHDKHERFNHPATPKEQIILGYALLFSLQGIPCLYYGTEQGLDGTKDKIGNPILNSFESVREALWGKPGCFNETHFFYTEIRMLTDLRSCLPTLRYGRLYFREISENGTDFGHSFGQGGIIAFSRILSSTETLVIANTSTTSPFKGFAWLDRDINQGAVTYSVLFSNKSKSGSGSPQRGTYNMWNNGSYSTCQGARLYIDLDPMEVQIIG